MRLAIVCTTLLGLMISGAAQAEKTGTVVELFTSQGCSSCPPADAILAELSGRDDVIPLALHVDYWDYLGWVDDLGSPAFTARQEAYARKLGAQTVYTPQMIVGGTEGLVGSHAMAVAETIQRHSAIPAAIELDVSRDGTTIDIAARSNGAAKDAVVQIVEFLPRIDRDIERGENAGRRITYVNTVTSWRNAGRWNTDQPLRMRQNVSGDRPVVVIVQDGTDGPILGAVQVD